jgi:pimeloyl-ACP methyl ester carboxylesterase
MVSFVRCTYPCIALAVIGACSSADDSRALERTPDAGGTDAGSVVVDAAVEATSDADASAPPLSAWARCAPPLPDTFECATLTVPLDYDHPEGATAALAVMRSPAHLRAQRRGVVFYNPGGAGGSGLDYLPPFLSAGTPLLGDALLYYDFVTFDVRGQGRSWPLFDCVDDASLTPIQKGLSPAILVDAGASPDEGVRTILSQCQARTPADLIANMDSGAVARDLDALRAALGESQLGFFGASYGTWLGAVYAHLFPSRVRAFVLDGPLSPTFDAEERQLAAARGTERALEDFFTWCDATAACTFRPASGTTREAFLALRDELDASPLAVSGDPPVDGARLRVLLRMTLTSLDVTMKLLSALRDRDASATATAMDPVPVESIEVNVAVNALDTAYPLGATIASVSDWAKTTLLPAAPLTGTFDPFVAGLELEYPARPAHPVTSLATTAAPVLVVAGQHDERTPLANAQPLIDALGNGSHLLVSETWGHVAFHSNRCARIATAAYFLDPTQAPATTDCPADPAQPNETRAGSVTATFASGPSNRTAETPIGDLITDAMRARYDGDLAITNGGGIRSGLPSTFLPADHTLRRPDAGYASGPPYDLTREDARHAMPFGNRALVMSMSGRAIWQMLDAAVTLAPAGSSAFLQLSGMHFSYSVSAAAGSRVRTVTLDDGATVVPNDESRTYRVVMTDFIYYGGVGPILTPDGKGIIHEDVADILADYLAAGAPMTPVTSSRIRALP